MSRREQVLRGLAALLLAPGGSNLGCPPTRSSAAGGSATGSAGLCSATNIRYSRLFREPGRADARRMPLPRRRRLSDFKTCCVVFRYHANTQIPYVTPIMCTNHMHHPNAVDCLNCNCSGAVDQFTCTHNAGCLLGPGCHLGARRRRRHRDDRAGAARRWRWSRSFAATGVVRRLPEPEGDESARTRPAMVRLERGGPGSNLSSTRTPPRCRPTPSGAQWRRDAAHDVGGRAPAGDTVAIAIATGRPTFGWRPCRVSPVRTFWDGLRPEGAGGTASRSWVVVKDREFESLELLELARRRARGALIGGVGAYASGCRLLLLRRRHRRDGALQGSDIPVEVRSLLTDAIADEELAQRKAEMRTP